MQYVNAITCMSCTYCNRKIKVGELFYFNGFFYDVNSKSYLHEIRECSSCNYNRTIRNLRIKKQQEECTHPDISVESRYKIGFGHTDNKIIPMFTHSECTLCGKILERGHCYEPSNDSLQTERQQYNSHSKIHY